MAHYRTSAGLDTKGLALIAPGGATHVCKADLTESHGLPSLICVSEAHMALKELRNRSKKIPVAISRPLLL